MMWIIMLTGHTKKSSIILIIKRDTQETIQDIILDHFPILKFTKVAC